VWPDYRAKTHDEEAGGDARATKKPLFFRGAFWYEWGLVGKGIDRGKGALWRVNC
jgi:hypothetical protein